MYATKKNTESYVVASKEIGLEVNADKTNYMVMSRDQNAGGNHRIKTDNSYFERWKSSNVCEQRQLNKILLRKKLRAD